MTDSRELNLTLEPLKSVGKNLKSSNYNYFILSNENFVLGYNFLYRTILKIPLEVFVKIDELFNLLLNKSIDFDLAWPNKVNLPEELIETLRDAHFLIDEEMDELSLIKFRYNKSLFASDTLSLVILPTLWCNFACPYCFEYKKNIFMTSEIENKLIKWIKKFSKKRHISVAWFGGEPLLAKDTIFRLTNEIKQFCSTINATYSASLTTNGFFLDPDFQKEIPNLNIHNVQITLDGNKNAHDQYRKQLNGDGSFDQIFDNIISFCENVPEDYNLSLRVNCSDDNYDEVNKLIENFPPKVTNRVSIFFRWIYANEASGNREFACSKRGEEPFEGLYKLYNSSSKQGLNTSNPHNDLLDGYCEVDYVDHFNVDPEGNLFLCTHTFDKSEVVGSIGDDSNSFNESYYTKWYSLDPFSDPECIKCILLPVCKGGCRKSRMEGHRECIEELNSLDLYVKNIVQERLNSKNKSN